MKDFLSFYNTDMSRRMFLPVLMCQIIPFQMSSAHVMSSELSRCAFEVAGDSGVYGVSAVEGCVPFRNECRMSFKSQTNS